MTTKDETLKESGCYNNNFENVSADIFAASLFFDKKDIVQVKYEMIRAASSGGSITEISDNFGFSRKSYYQALAAFNEGGLHALIPKKKGPKRAHKLSDDVQTFIESYLTDNTDAKAKEILKAINDEMDVSMDIRTVYRYLKKN